MLNLKKSIIYICYFSFTLFATIAQELPPIDVFTPRDYNAGNQNWDISQGNNKYIYVANNKGLLEYNGEVWNLYKSPNETIIRSVEVVANRIYTGCYMEFGYWNKLDTGELEYISLSKSHNINFIEDEQIWNIIRFNKWVLFQSHNKMYIYNSELESFKVVNAKSKIGKSFLLDDGNIFYQDSNYGLFNIKQGNSELVNSLDFLNKELIIDVFQDVDGYVLLTQNHGFFHLNSKTNKIKEWDINSNKIIEKYTVYSGLKLENGDYVLGTISNGLLLLNKNGTLKYKIDQNKGLNNNTVLSVFEDVDNNLWLSLDNGINCINNNAPLRIYNDEKGSLGTVYASVIYKGNFYLGTNQGLFFKAIDTEDNFQFIKNTQGQVWDLQVIDDVLFCGHNMGTYIIKGMEAQQISEIKGTWSVKKIPNKPNLLLQGNYDGLHVLEKNKGQWFYRNKIEGFDISSRFFELMNQRVFVNHEYKGVFKVDINNDFKKVIKTVCDTTLKGLNSSLINYKNNLLYAYKEGIYKYEIKSDKFKRDTLLSKVYSSGNYVSGKLINDEKGEKLWGFTNTGFVYVSPGKFSEKQTIKQIELSTFITKGVSGYENLLNIDNENYLFGTSSGYAIININKPNSQKFKIAINSIRSGKFNAINTVEKLTGDGIFNKEINSFEFCFSVPNFRKNIKALYQYKLKGIHENWSSWDVNPKVRYENLPSGDYVFKVRSKIRQELSVNEATYKFTIKAPWYLTNSLLVVYVLLFVILLYIFNRFCHNYYERSKEKTLLNIKNELALKELENKQQLMRFENEKLLQDIDNKSKELAISTMSLIKKNKFLNKLKKELISKNSNSTIKDVVSIIDKNINNNDDWQFFEQAFQNADKDFMHKIKAIHPSLTPNDLKLCAYLRLNLSSKEIAPLLNISSRSVEVKRYRLRKKMNLEHGMSLTSHILDI